MFETKRVTAELAVKDGGGEGAVQAAFSVFDVVDSQGDVVLKSAFTAGQTVAMTWSHDWSQIIGKGVVRLTDDEAIFDGRFFTETTAGRDAYLTVKAMGAAQQWSFGFQISAAEPGVKDGQDVRFIKSLEVFEASPVLVGANRATRTLAIKGHGLSFDEHVDQALGALEELLARVRSGAESRAQEKVGRPISAARRARLATTATAIRAGADEIDAMLAETDPDAAKSDTAAQPSPTGSVDAAALVALRDQFRRFEARHGLALPLET